MLILSTLFNRYALGFFIHITVMMLIFVQKMPKRSHFWLRLLGLAPVCLAACYFFPEEYEVLGGLFKPFFLVTFFLVSFYIWACFEMKYYHVLFYCSAMFAMQNLCFHLYAIICSALNHDVFDEILYVPANYFLSFILAAAVYYLYVEKNKLILEARLKSSRFIFIVVFVLFVVLILNSVSGVSDWTRQEYIIIQLLLMSCDTFVLLLLFGAVEQSQAEMQKEVMERVLRMEQQRHEISKETIDLINRKSHDLKHQISLLQSTPDAERQEVLKEMEEAIAVYDSVARTGNDTLDIILTEKSLLCEKYNIILTCVADGASMQFMSTPDLYSLFGNLLDNAIESVVKLEEKEQRVIQLHVAPKGKYLVIRMENYYGNEIIMEEGLPVTTKQDRDYHGFGMKSIRYIVEKYNGHMEINTENQIFHISIVLPIP